MDFNFKAKVGGLVTSLMFFVFGLYSLLGRNPANHCQMTYMYGYPQYMELNLGNEVREQFPVYQLFVYGEDGYAERLKADHFDGIPVLFLPGSAGSHKQVRSLASVALRKFMDDRTPFHFNFFAVDFNEDLSALQGSLLLPQTAFVKHCIPYILSLYSNSKHPPKSVVLIGHSMGGMIAKGIFSFPDFDSQSVSTIFTLATPHQLPVVALDTDILNFYEQVRYNWEENTTRTSHVMLVSVGGGANDWYVRSELTLANSPAISALTTSIPDVRLTTDHLCMAWCKQLVLVIVRSLFDMVDTRTSQMTQDTEVKQSVVNYHLKNKSAGKRWVRPDNSFITLEPSAAWEEVLDTSFAVKSTNRNNLYVFSPFSESNKDYLVAVATNLGNKEWMYGCTEIKINNRGKYCDRARSVRELVEYLPSYSKSKKFVRVDLWRLKDHGFLGLVFVLPPTRKEPAAIQVETFTTSERTFVVNGNGFGHTLGFGSFYTLGGLNNGSMISVLQLPFLRFKNQAYQLSFTSESCSEPVVVEISVPWSIEKDTKIIDPKNGLGQLFYLHTNKPLNSSVEESVQMFLLTTPNCTYNLTIRLDYFAFSKQSLVLYGPFIPGFVAAVVLDLLRHQIGRLHSDGYVPSFWSCFPLMSSLMLVVTPFALGPLFNLLRRYKINLTQTDYEAIDFRGLNGVVVSFFLYFISVGIVLLIHLCSKCLIAFSVVFEKMGRRLCISVYAMWMLEWIVKGLQRYPLATFILMAAISISTCGPVGLLLGILLGILQHCALEQKIVEGFLFGESKDSSDEKLQTLKRISLTFTTLWLTVFVTGLPTLIHWTKNKGSVPRDSLLIPTLLLWFSHPLLWNSSTARGSGKYLRLSKEVLRLAAVGCVAFATVSLYRIPWIIGLSTTIVELIVKWENYSLTNLK